MVLISPRSALLYDDEQYFMKAAEYVSPGEGPGSLCLLPVFSSFFVTLFSLRVGIKGGEKGEQGR